MPRKLHVQRDDESDSSENFQTPSTRRDITNYSFEYSRNRIVNRNQPSTSAAAATNQKTYARKSTGGASPHKRNPTTRAGISKNHSNAESPSQRRSLRHASPVHKPQIDRRPRKQKKPISAQLRLVKEMQRLCSQTTFLIPRAPFGRAVREIMNDCSNEVRMITRTALEAIQEASELYLTQVLSDAYALTCHRGRVTLSVKDIQLLRIIRLIE